MKHAAMTALALALTLTLGLSFVRADEALSRGQAGDTLTPLALGNTWVYEDADADLIHTERIEGVVTFDQTSWYMLRNYEREIGQPPAKNESIDLEYWLAFHDGYECDTIMHVDEETQILKPGGINKAHRYPAKLGDQYHPYADDQDATVTVLALNEKVTTKAGVFDCIVYKETSTQDESFNFTTYIAPGVGVVKSTFIEEGQTYTSELISYTLVEKD